MEEENEKIKIANDLCQVGDVTGACEHFDEALDLATTRGDKQQQGLILVGKGFALLQHQKIYEAIDALEKAKVLAEEESQVAQATFLKQTIEATRQRNSKVLKYPDGQLEDEMGQFTIKAFVSGLLRRSPVTVILNSTEENCYDNRSRDMLLLLYKLRTRFKVLDATTDEQLATQLTDIVEHVGVPCISLTNREGDTQFIGAQAASLRNATSLRKELQEKLGLDVWTASSTLEPEEFEEIVEKESLLLARVSHSNRIRQFLTSFITERVGKVLSNAVDPVEVLFSDCDDVSKTFSDLISALSDALGGHIPKTISIGDISLSERITIDEIIEYVERVCPANGNCAACPSSGDCKVHEADCVDLEDLTMQLSSCGMAMK